MASKQGVQPWRLATGRRGITLIELLVVIFILLLITAIAIPIMAPNVEERRANETSRLVTSFLAGARTRAIETNRPFGVMLEPMAGQPEACILMWFVEVQPPYAGDSVASTAVITEIGSTNTYQVNLPSDSAWQGLIRPGDLIKFNYQGHYYQINETSVDGNGYLAAGSLPWPIALVGPGLIDIEATLVSFSTPAEKPLPYQIFRRPVKTSAPPLQLPDGMVIDLQWSGAPPTFTGVSAASSFASLGGPVILLFSPNGSLSSVMGPTTIFTPTGPAHLLLGTRVNVPANPEFGINGNTIQYNYQDPRNHWVTIHPQTGLIGREVPGGDSDSSGVISMLESRQYAVEGKTLGGR